MFSSKFFYCIKLEFLLHKQYRRHSFPCKNVLKYNKYVLYNNVLFPEFISLYVKPLLKIKETKINLYNFNDIQKSS